MDNEREVEKVFDILDKHITLKHKAFTDNIAGEWDAAKAIVEAGYRKADEVYKETIKEILTKVRQLYKEHTDVAFLSNDPALKFYVMGKEEGFRTVCEYLVNLMGGEVN